MAALLMQRNGGDYDRAPLVAGSIVELGVDKTGELTFADSKTCTDVVAHLCESGRSWALVWDTRRITPFINGVRCVAGLKILRHGDEVRLSGCPDRTYLSTESVVEIAAHAGEPRPCVRCGQAVGEGDLSIVCVCGGLYHEDEANGLYCYSLGPCKRCGKSIEVGGGYTFAPGEF